MKNKISSAEKGRKAGGPALQRAFGALWKYYSDNEVREIFIDAFDRVSVERKGKLEAVAPLFASKAALAAFVKALAAFPGSSSRRAGGRGGAGAVLDVRLPDQTRVTSAEGPAYHAVIIRKMPGGLSGWAELLKRGCVSQDVKKLFDRITGEMKSLLIAGNSGSGKTTLVNVIANGIPAGRRIVAIQSNSELILKHPSCLCLDASSDDEFVELLLNADKFSADHLVVGELDGIGVPEAVRAMRNGMAVVASCHAESVLDALKRLELMYLSSKTAFGLDEIRTMLASGIKYVSFQERAADGKRRVVDLSRIKGYEDGRYIIEPLLKYSYAANAFELTPAGKALLA
ncbi:MAG: ATPase, T2SS/T4P/T4SS family [Elusimicrobia bacterium]|nr:ATPase, T2SS/T4P/T4SS family [Elusimicrobiota bacterium]